ncbi:MAG: terminase small subunit [Candidatus Doudnabacteria bacterium]|nr:terminase small subunit [Candidatus Doudnabacteria bacterium]
MGKLNDKQERFCREYVIDLNGTQSAIRAGYSKKTAASIANENLIKPEIQEFISSLQKGLSDKLDITSERVIAELAKIAFSNIQDYIEDDNTITDLKQIPRETAAAVESIKKTSTEWGTDDKGGVKTHISFKLYDKIAALEKLGKHLGIFEADNKQKTTVINVLRPEE